MLKVKYNSSMLMKYKAAKEMRKFSKEKGSI